MATAVNDITGALITTKGKSTTNYGDNYDRIFRKGTKVPEPKPHITAVQLLAGEHFIVIPEDAVRELNWRLGDQLEASVENGKLSLTKR